MDSVGAELDPAAAALAALAALGVAVEDETGAVLAAKADDGSVD